MTNPIDAVPASLLEAAARRDTWPNALAALALVANDDNVARFRQRAETLGIPTDHLPWNRKVSEVTSEDLRRVAMDAPNRAAILGRLGIRASKWAYEWLDRRCLQDGIPLPPSPRHEPLQRIARSRVSDDQLRSAFEEARSVADLLRRVGLVPRGSNYRDIGERLAGLGLDVTKLRGQGWSRGTRPTFTLRPLHEYLRSGTKVSSSWLGKRLVKEGVLQRRCSCCWLERWLGGPIPLELDHINGDSRDNRLENLRLLCPNCHALTPTYRGRNIGATACAPTLPFEPG
jgi:hypothetical protein